MLHWGWRWGWIFGTANRWGFIAAKHIAQWRPIRYREDNYSNIIFDLVYWLLFYSIIYDAILDIFVMNYWRKVIRKIAACSKKIKMYRAIILKQVPQKIPVRIVILWTSLTYLLSNLSLVVSLNKFDILELSESPVRVLILLLKLFVDTFLEDGCFLNRLANSEKKITKKNITQLKFYVKWLLYCCFYR